MNTVIASLAAVAGLIAFTIAAGPAIRDHIRRNR